MKRRKEGRKEGTIDSQSLILSPLVICCGFREEILLCILSYRYNQSINKQNNSYGEKYVIDWIILFDIDIPRSFAAASNSERAAVLFEAKKLSSSGDS